jgi:Uma2 family endonuclease
MASPAGLSKTITLEVFLRMPEIDEQPYPEFADGNVEAKVPPQKKHSMLAKRLMNQIDAQAEPRRVGQTFPELRCTFAGRSMIPDVAFLHDEHIETDERGEILDPTLRPPDIHIEIVSPDRPVGKCREKLVFSTVNGCPLGWLIDPGRGSVSIFRPGRRAVRLSADGAFEGDPGLLGYRLPIAELFGWLTVRRPNAAPPSQAGSNPRETS